MIRESLCTPNTELLSVSLRPFYLPREFPRIFITLVYIHPKAIVDAATRVIVETVHRLHSIAPDGPNLVTGDFTNCKPGNLCYGSIKGVYKSLHRAPPGMSDHSVVYLALTYKPVLKEIKPETVIAYIILY